MTEWVCKFCTFSNPGHRRKCDLCKSFQTQEKPTGYEEDFYNSKPSKRSLQEVSSPASSKSKSSKQPAASQSSSQSSQSTSNKKSASNRRSMKDDDDDDDNDNDNDDDSNQNGEDDDEEDDKKAKGKEKVTRAKRGSKASVVQSKDDQDEDDEKSKPKGRSKSTKSSQEAPKVSEKGKNDKNSQNNDITDDDMFSDDEIENDKGSKAKGKNTKATTPAKSSASSKVTTPAKKSTPNKASSSTRSRRSMKDESEEEEEEEDDDEDDKEEEKEEVVDNKKRSARGKAAAKAEPIVIVDKKDEKNDKDEKKDEKRSTRRSNNRVTIITDRTDSESERHSDDDEEEEEEEEKEEEKIVPKRGKPNPKKGGKNNDPKAQEQVQLVRDDVITLKKSPITSTSNPRSSLFDDTDEEEKKEDIKKTTQKVEEKDEKKTVQKKSDKKVKSDNDNDKDQHLDDDQNEDNDQVIAPRQTSVKRPKSKSTKMVDEDDDEDEGETLSKSQAKPSFQWYQYPSVLAKCTPSSHFNIINNSQFNPLYYQFSYLSIDNVANIKSKLQFTINILKKQYQYNLLRSLSLYTSQTSTKNKNVTQWKLKTHVNNNNNDNDNIDDDHNPDDGLLVSIVESKHLFQSISLAKQEDNIDILLNEPTNILPAHLSAGLEDFTDSIESYCDLATSITPYLTDDDFKSLSSPTPSQLLNHLPKFQSHHALLTEFNKISSLSPPLPDEENELNYQQQDSIFSQLYQSLPSQLNDSFAVFAEASAQHNDFLSKTTIKLTTKQQKAFTRALAYNYTTNPNHHITFAIPPTVVIYHPGLAAVARKSQSEQQNIPYDGFFGEQLKGIDTFDPITRCINGINPFLIPKIILPQNELSSLSDLYTMAVPHRLAGKSATELWPLSAPPSTSEWLLEDQILEHEPEIRHTIESLAAHYQAMIQEAESKHASESQASTQENRALDHTINDIEGQYHNAAVQAWAKHLQNHPEHSFYEDLGEESWPPLPVSTIHPHGYDITYHVKVYHQTEYPHGEIIPQNLRYTMNQWIAIVKRFPPLPYHRAVVFRVLGVSSSITKIFDTLAPFLAMKNIHFIPATNPPLVNATSGKADDEKKRSTISPSIHTTHTLCDTYRITERSVTSAACSSEMFPSEWLFLSLIHGELLPRTYTQSGALISSKNIVDDERSQSDSQYSQTLSPGHEETISTHNDGVITYLFPRQGNKPLQQPVVEHTYRSLQQQYITGFDAVFGRFNQILDKLKNCKVLPNQLKTLLTQPSFLQQSQPIIDNPSKFNLSLPYLPIPPSLSLIPQRLRLAPFLFRNSTWFVIDGVEEGIDSSMTFSFLSFNGPYIRELLRLAGGIVLDLGDLIEALLLGTIIAKPDNDYDPSNPSLEPTSQPTKPITMLNGNYSSLLPSPLVFRPDVGDLKNGETNINAVVHNNVKFTYNWDYFNHKFNLLPPTQSKIQDEKNKKNKNNNSPHLLPTWSPSNNIKESHDKHLKQLLAEHIPIAQYKTRFHKDDNEDDDEIDDANVTFPNEISTQELDDVRALQRCEAGVLHSNDLYQHFPLMVVAPWHSKANSSCSGVYQFWKRCVIPYAIQHKDRIYTNINTYLDSIKQKSPPSKGQTFYQQVSPLPITNQDLIARLVLGSTQLPVFTLLNLFETFARGRYQQPVIQSQHNPKFPQLISRYTLSANLQDQLSDNVLISAEYDELPSGV